MPQIAREKHIASDEKARLSETIKSQARSHSFLDEQVVSCYTEGKELSQGSECDEENTLCVSRQHLPQPDGGVPDEGLGEEGRTGITVPYRVGSDQPGGDW